MALPGDGVDQDIEPHLRFVAHWPASTRATSVAEEARNENETS